LILANYISDLLYRYECVIVPNFGGFIVNNKSATIDSINHILSPPYKQITYNSHLKNNDGLLANYIASVDKISYECALNYIRFEIEEWKEKLKNADIYLEGIGSFSLIHGKLHFEPQKAINYLTSSYGLSNVISKKIKREETAKQKDVKLTEKAPVVLAVESKKAPNYLKYAAIFILGLSLIGFGGKWYSDYQNDQMLVKAKEQQEIIENKIENATFVITKPLPTLNLDLIVDKKNFHVIAGAFRFPQNAVRKVSQLKFAGYDDARILGVNRWNLSVVTFGSYSTRQEAVQDLIDIRVNVEKDVWLLIQEF
jgi:cell division protein FtsN